jgi:hypothetical protein
LESITMNYPILTYITFAPLVGVLAILLLKDGCLFLLCTVRTLHLPRLVLPVIHEYGTVV